MKKNEVYELFFYFESYSFILLVLRCENNFLSNFLRLFFCMEEYQLVELEEDLIFSCILSLVYFLDFFEYNYQLYYVFDGVMYGFFLGFCFGNFRVNSIYNIYLIYYVFVV